MFTEIFVKETKYGSLIVKKDINKTNYEDNFDYILEQYQEQGSDSFESITNFALSMQKLDVVPQKIDIDKESINDNEIIITDVEDGILKSIRLQKNEQNQIELHIRDKKGQVEKIITLT